MTDGDGNVTPRRPRRTVREEYNQTNDRAPAVGMREEDRKPNAPQILETFSQDTEPTRTTHPIITSLGCVGLRQREHFDSGEQRVASLRIALYRRVHAGSLETEGLSGWGAALVII